MVTDSDSDTDSDMDTDYLRQQNENIDDGEASAAPRRSRWSWKDYVGGAVVVVIAGAITRLVAPHFFASVIATLTFANTVATLSAFTAVGVAALLLGTLIYRNIKLREWGWLAVERVQEGAQEVKKKSFWFEFTKHFLVSALVIAALVQFSAFQLPILVIRPWINVALVAFLGACLLKGISALLAIGRRSQGSEGVGRQQHALDQQTLEALFYRFGLNQHLKEKITQGQDKNFKPEPDFPENFPGGNIISHQTAAPEEQSYMRSRGYQSNVPLKLFFQFTSKAHKTEQMGNDFASIIGIRPMLPLLKK